MAALFRTISEGADIVFAIAARANIFEAVSLTILPLDHLPNVFRAVLQIVAFVNAQSGMAPLDTATPHAAKGPRDFVLFPITADSAKSAIGWAPLRRLGARGC
jgi:hypothetical protein